MSWHCLPEGAAGFSGASSLDGAVCAPSKWSPTLVTCCLPASATDFLIASLFGTTCKPSTATPGAGTSMSSAAASPAKTSALQARAPESTASAAGFGATWRGSLARFDPSTSSWRTAQPSLLGDSGECSVTWPRSGMTADGLCWELPMLGRPTSATGSGLWATPIATDGSKCPSDSLSRQVNPALQKTWRSASSPIWPTPTQDSATERSSRYAQGGLPLTLAVAMWPTPTICGNYNRKGASPTSGDGLATAVKYATPLARDHKSGEVSQATRDKNSRPLSEQLGGSLNPDWVELLMHWPAGWTNLQPMASADMRGWGEGWEDGIPRVAIGVPKRVQRLKAIGNGQVPVCMAVAWRMLAVP